MALSSPGLQADELSLQLTLDTRLTINDNVDLTATNRRQSSILVATPQLRFARRLESAELAGTLALTANHYQNLPDHNRVDGRASLSGSWSAERDQWGATLQAVRDSTLNTETPTTGIILVRRQRTSTDFMPQWQRALTPTTKAAVSARLTEVNYEKGSGLVDYSNLSVSLSLERELSERTIVSAGLGASRYRAAQDVSKSDGQSYTLGLQHRLTERLNFSLQAGRQEINIVQRQNQLVCSIVDLTSGACLLFSNITVPVETHQGVSSYGLSANQMIENGSYSLSVSRSVNPTGTGSLVSTDGFSLSHTRELREDLSFSGSVSRVRSHNLGNLAGSAHMTQVGANLLWKVEQNIGLGFSLLRTEQRSLAGRAAIEANQVAVNLNYAFDPITGSR